MHRNGLGRVRRQKAEGIGTVGSQRAPGDWLRWVTLSDASVGSPSRLLALCTHTHTTQHTRKKPPPQGARCTGTRTQQGPQRSPPTHRGLSEVSVVKRRRQSGGLRRLQSILPPPVTVGRGLPGPDPPALRRPLVGSAEAQCVVDSGPGLSVWLRFWASLSVCVPVPSSK